MKVGAHLADSNELVHRQVHPNFVIGGRVTSAAFQPTKKDSGLLSVNRGSMRSAEESHRAFVAGGLTSWGTLSVSVAEIETEGLSAVEAPLSVDDDPPDMVNDESHAAIDFRSLSGERKLQEKRARKLRDAGVMRGPYLAP